MNGNSQVLQIPLIDIIPNQFQPRMNFDEKELQELSDSIKEHGIIQPLVLRKMGQKYEIIAGERRYRAAGMSGLTTVPAIISNIDDQASAEVALVENVQRKDLTAIEEARSYKNILDKGYLTQEQLAKKMGLSQPAIANKLRLLNLDETVQQALLNGKISERHARSLLSISNKEDQKKWLDRILKERLTVRQLDIEIKKETLLINDDNNALSEVAPKIEDLTFNTPITTPLDTENNFFNFNENPQPVSQNTNDETNQNKFFNFLDEKSNVNSSENEVFSPFADNKFINFNLSGASSEPVMNASISSNQTTTKFSDLETLFDPMDNVDLLDPNFAEKQKEEAGLDLKSAINETRGAIEDLKFKGFAIEMDEIDMENHYQITIKIKK